MTKNNNLDQRTFISDVYREMSFSGILFKFIKPSKTRSQCFYFKNRSLEKSSSLEIESGASLKISLPDS